MKIVIKAPAIDVKATMYTSCSMLVVDKKAVNIAPMQMPENTDTGISNFFILANWNYSSYFKTACSIFACNIWNAKSTNNRGFDFYCS